MPNGFLWRNPFLHFCEKHQKAVPTYCSEPVPWHVCALQCRHSRDLRRIRRPESRNLLVGLDDDAVGLERIDEVCVILHQQGRSVHSSSSAGFSGVWSGLPRRVRRPGRTSCPGRFWSRRTWRCHHTVDILLKNFPVCLDFNQYVGTFRSVWIPQQVTDGRNVFHVLVCLIGNICEKGRMQRCRQSCRCWTLPHHRNTAGFPSMISFAACTISFEIERLFASHWCFRPEYNRSNALIHFHQTAGNFINSSPRCRQRDLTWRKLLCLSKPSPTACVRWTMTSYPPFTKHR